MTNGKDINVRILKENFRNINFLFSNIPKKSDLPSNDIFHII